MTKMGVTSSRPRLMAKISTSSSSHSLKAMEDLGGKVLLQWKPVLNGPELLVMQGDLTSCKADAIVNAANIHLSHGGGLAGAIVRKGGSSIQEEGSKWIKENGPLKVGDAVTTKAGKLPCKHVIHTVGPNVGDKEPTDEHSAQLRRAVWSALIEADALGIESVAVPGISTGIFGYPRDLGAVEIVNESVRFCREKDKTAVKRIALMNIDDPTVNSFIKALTEMKKKGDEEKEKDLSDEMAELNLRE